MKGQKEYSSLNLVIVFTFALKLSMATSAEMELILKSLNENLLVKLLIFSLLYSQNYLFLFFKITRSNFFFIKKRKRLKYIIEFLKKDSFMLLPFE